VLLLKKYSYIAAIYLLHNGEPGPREAGKGHSNTVPVYLLDPEYSLSSGCLKGLQVIFGTL